MLTPKIIEYGFTALFDYDAGRLRDGTSSNTLLQAVRDARDALKGGGGSDKPGQERLERAVLALTDTIPGFWGGTGDNVGAVKQEAVKALQLVRVAPTLLEAKGFQYVRVTFLFDDDDQGRPVVATAVKDPLVRGATALGSRRTDDKQHWLVKQLLDAGVLVSYDAAALLRKKKRREDEETEHVERSWNTDCPLLPLTLLLLPCLALQLVWVVCVLQ